MGVAQPGARPPDVVELTVPSDARFLELIHTFTKQICKHAGHLSSEEVYKIGWSVHEACVNAIEHAHHFQASKPLRVQAVICPDCLEFRVYDLGPGFDLERVPEPEPDEVVERGRGLMGIRECVDVLEYRRMPQCNCLRLVRRMRAVV